MSRSSHVIEAAGGIVYRWTANGPPIRHQSGNTAFADGIQSDAGSERDGIVLAADDFGTIADNPSDGGDETVNINERRDTANDTDDSRGSGRGRHAKRAEVPANAAGAARLSAERADEPAQNGKKGQKGGDEQEASGENGSPNTTQLGNDGGRRSGKANKHKAHHAKRERNDFPGLEVCLVHRPKYDDWSWPKGKNEENESSRHTAVREIEEECGVPVALGVHIGEVEYPLEAEGSTSKRAGSGSVYLKHVDYWMATPISSEESGRRQTAVGPINPASPKEVDEVVWLSIPAARKKLTHSLDRDVLDQFVDLAKQGAIGARALIIVRHSKAEARKRWQGTDANRPITPRGAAASFALMRELGCYSPTRIVSSPWLRCMESILQYAWHAQLPIHKAPALTEDAFAADPEAAWTQIMHEIDNLFTDGTYLEQADENPQRPDSSPVTYFSSSDSSLTTSIPHETGHTSISRGQDAASETGSVETVPPYNENSSPTSTHTTLVSMHRPVIGGVFEHLRAICLSKSLAKQLITKTPYMVTGSAVALFIIDTPEGRRIIDIQKVTPFVY